MTSTAIKSERIETLVTKDQHDLLAYAASLEGRDMKDFIVESAQEAAMRTIEDRTMIRMATEHQQRFAEAMLVEVEPNDALRDAFSDYRKTCTQEP